MIIDKIVTYLNNAGGSNCKIIAIKKNVETILSNTILNINDNNNDINNNTSNSNSNNNKIIIIIIIIIKPLNTKPKYTNNKYC